MSKQTIPIASCDLETNPFRHGAKLTPFLAGWYDGKRIYKFWGDDCLQQCWKSMRAFKGYIYLHNGGKFDLRFFLAVIPPSEIVPDGNPPINGRISTLKIVNGPTFLDSYLILPVPLSAHGKETIDYSIFEPDRREIPANRKLINSYFDTDLISLYDFVTDFITEYGHGLTLAGRAFDQGKKLLDIKKMPQSSQFYDKKYRVYYYGGRTQNFCLGRIDNPVKCYDINSAYPFAMLFRHAWGCKFTVSNTIPDRSFEQSFIRVRGIADGCFPFRGEDNLQYPWFTDKQPNEWFVTGWELKAALETGAFKIHEIISCHTPERTRDFAPYVNHFYDLKKNAKTPSEKLFAKLMLNSFYGRFALNPRTHEETLWLPYGEKPDETEYGKGWKIKKIWEDCDLVLWGKPKEEKRWRFFDVALAASITGYVRAMMWRSLCTVDKPVYCDTDSIICADGKGLKIGKELGEWKLEAETETNSFWCAGRKLYAMRTNELLPSIPEGREKEVWSKEDGQFRHWKTASKGVRLSPSEIIKVSNGESVQYKSEAPSFSLYRQDGYTIRNVKRGINVRKFSHANAKTNSIS